MTQRGCEHIEAMLRTIEASTVNVDASLKWADSSASSYLVFSCKCGAKYESDASIGGG